MSKRIIVTLTILFSIYGQGGSQNFQKYANSRESYSDTKSTTVVSDTVYSSHKNGVSRFVNGSWEDLPDAFNTYQETYAIEVVNGNHIYLGSGPNPTRFVKWDGTSWQNVGNLPSNVRRILDIHYQSDDEIYLISRLDNNTTYFYKFDGTNWEDLNYPTGEERIREFKYVAEDEIYLIDTKGVIRKYDGTSVSVLTSDFYDTVTYAFTDNVFQVYNNKIYGCDYNDVGVYDLQTNTFSKLGDLYSNGEQKGTIDNILVRSENDIYVNVRVYNSQNDFFIAHWDGTSWEQFERQFNGTNDSPQFLMNDSEMIYFKLWQDNNYYRYDTSTLTNTEFKKTVQTEVFPNPTSNMVYVSSEITPIKIEVFNSLGQKMDVKNDNFKKLALPQKSGIYYLKIYHNIGVELKKVVVK